MRCGRNLFIAFVLTAMNMCTQELACIMLWQLFAKDEQLEVLKGDGDGSGGAAIDRNSTAPLPADLSNASPHPRLGKQVKKRRATMLQGMQEIFGLMSTTISTKDLAMVKLLEFLFETRRSRSCCCKGARCCTGTTCTTPAWWTTPCCWCRSRSALRRWSRA